MLGTIAAVVLGAAFVAAGVFKLVDGPAWPKQAADMGVVRPVAVVVPWVEIVIGVALAAQFLEPWPALAAIVFLIGATVVIVRRLLDGSRPPCACFRLPVDPTPRGVPCGAQRRPARAGDSSGRVGVSRSKAMRAWRPSTMTRPDRLRAEQRPEPLLPNGPTSRCWSSRTWVVYRPRGRCLRDLQRDGFARGEATVLCAERAAKTPFSDDPASSWWNDQMPYVAARASASPARHARTPTAAGRSPAVDHEPDLTVAGISQLLEDGALPAPRRRTTAEGTDSGWRPASSTDSRGRDGARPDLHVSLPSGERRSVVQPIRAALTNRCMPVCGWQLPVITTATGN